MKKLNNSGFVLVETLVVSVVVMLVLSIIYTNFNPMIGEYEQREKYDDVDSKYAAYWIKRIIQSSAVEANTIYNSLGKDNTSGTSNYIQFVYDLVTDISKKELYKNLVSKLNINIDSAGQPIIYITKYNLGDASSGFKKVVYDSIKDNSNTFTRGLEEYIKYLPSFTTPSINNAQYRIVIQFHRTKDDNDIYTYSTIEVIK